MKKYADILLIGLALAACHNDIHSTQPDIDQQTDTVADIRTFVTTADNTMHFDKISRNFGTGLNMMPEKTLVLKPEEKYQTFDGFGAAITGAAACNLLQMPAEARAKLLDETFNVQTGMGYSYVRVPIGGSDFPAHSNLEYTCCDMQGIDNFALTSEETQFIIPVLKQILAVNPDLKVLGSPWSCPRWMKVGDVNTRAPYNEWVGGFLNPDYYRDYAQYFVKWIQAFQAEFKV